MRFWLLWIFKLCDSVGYGVQFVICLWYFYFFWGGKYGGGGILFLSSLSEPGGTASSERRRGSPIHSIRAVYFRNRWFRFADELLPVIVKFILNGSGVQIYF